MAVTVISATDYLSIANQYDTAREQVLRAICNLLSATQVIVDLTGADALIPEVDLLNTFYGVYLSMSDTWTATAALLPAVRAINNHVINRDDSVNNLNDFANNNSIIYPYFWAELCSNAGFTIAPEYIGAAPTDYPFC